MVRPARWLLVLGGVSTLITAVAHLTLPRVYNWAPHLAGLADSLRWALYAINAFFSALLILAGAATLRAARSAHPDPVVVAGMTGFWLFNLVYQLVFPFPHPRVSLIARTFALAVVACYGVPLLLVRRRRVDTRR